MLAHGFVPFPEVTHTADPPNPPMFAYGFVPFPESDLTPTIFTPCPDHIQTLPRSVIILEFRSRALSTDLIQTLPQPVSDLTPTIFRPYNESRASD